MKSDSNNPPVYKNCLGKWLRVAGMGISIGSFFLLFSGTGIAAPPIPLPPHPPGLPRPPLPVPPPVLVPPLPPGPPVVVRHPPGLPPHPGWIWVPGYHRGHRWVPGYWSRPKRHRPRYDHPGPPPRRRPR